MNRALVGTALTFALLFPASVAVAVEGYGFTALTRALRSGGGEEPQVLGAAALATAAYFAFLLFVLALRKLGGSAAVVPAALVAVVAAVASHLVAAYVVVRHDELSTNARHGLVDVARGFHSFALLALAATVCLAAAALGRDLAAAGFAVAVALTVGAFAGGVADAAELALPVWVLVMGIAMTLGSQGRVGGAG